MINKTNKQELSVIQSKISDLELELESTKRLLRDKEHEVIDLSQRLELQK